MKLLSVSVEGCGRFGTPARIEGFGPGVNILSARNEAGKSTLFRAIRTCLFERHSSTAREVAGLATDGLSLPVSITVAFEHDGKRYEIAKSFLKGKSASLVRDGVEIARNAEADEHVWNLLGIAQVHPRAGRGKLRPAVGAAGPLLRLARTFGGCRKPAQCRHPARGGHTRWRRARSPAAGRGEGRSRPLPDG
jgi:hypothetical protein